MKKRFIPFLACVCAVLCACSQKQPDIDNVNHFTGATVITSFSEPQSAQDIPDEPVETPIFSQTTAPDEVTDESTGESELTEEPITQASTEKTTAQTTTEKTTAQTTTEKTTPTTPEPTTTEQTTTEPLTEETTVKTEPPTQIGSNSYIPLNYSEVKGVWISYIELSTLLTGKSESQFTANIKRVYENCVDLGLNTVYVHARAFGDAFYKSDYYPWSKYVTGKIGVSPSFDPYKIMVEQAHAYGLSFQAWINPYRICSDSDISSVSSSFAIGKWYSDSSTRGDYVVKVGSYWYLNPAYDECSDLIANGAGEIVAKYDVDGVHIDDYFYPTTDASFDSVAFAASGYSSLSEFRLSNCDRMVKGLYNAVKSANSKAIFGASTQGNVDNNLRFMYANVKKWCSQSGYVDYMAPQIYYGFKNSGQPYVTCLNEWQTMVSGTDVKIIPGLAVYKIGEADTYGGATGQNEWIEDEQIIKRQILASREIDNYGGFVLYSYNYVFSPSAHEEQIEAEMNAVKEII